MERISLRQGAYLSILLILNNSCFITASENRLVASAKELWDSAFCRKSRNALSEHPKETFATALGAGMVVAGAPFTGGLMAAATLALNSDRANNLFEQTPQACNRLLESANNGCEQLNAELRATLHTGMVDLQNIGTSVTDQIGHSADRAIYSIGQATNDLTLKLGDSASNIVATAGLAFEGNIAQLGKTGAQIADSLNNAAQNFGTETRRSTQFAFKTFWQTLGFGSLSLVGVALIYKNIMNHTGDKSTLFASIGGGITFASFAVLKLMLNRDLATENAHAQEREARHAEERSQNQAQAEALRNRIAAQQETQRLESTERRMQQIAKNGPSTDSEVKRMCDHVRSSAEAAEKLATSLALKSTIKSEDRATTQNYILHSIKAAYEKLNLANHLLENRIRKALKKTRERLATQLEGTTDDQERAIIERILNQEETEAKQTIKHNNQIIQDKFEELCLTEKLIQKLLGITDDSSSAVAASSY